MTPELTPDLVMTPVGDELLVYHNGQREVHCLIGAAREALESCAKGEPAEVAEGVWGELQSKGLIRSRRQFVAAATGLILTMALPRPARAASCVVCDGLSTDACITLMAAQACSDNGDCAQVCVLELPYNGVPLDGPCQDTTEPLFVCMTNPTPFAVSCVDARQTLVDAGAAAKTPYYCCEYAC